MGHGVERERQLGSRGGCGGARKSENKLPVNLTAHPYAKFYMTGTGTWDRDGGLRVMHLLRRLRHCHAQNATNCPFTKDDTQQLAQKFVAYELGRFDSETWHKGYDGSFFDLGAQPAFQYWTLLVDIFWGDPLLTAAAKTKRSKPNSALKSIASLIHYETGHWSLVNGNNSTPVLVDAAISWAITYYYEDPRARDVLENRSTRWKHRDFFLNDGSYKEGIMQYASMSTAACATSIASVQRSFGAPIRSVRWDITAKTSRWFIDFMTPDGTMVDFGDSWAVRASHVIRPAVDATLARTHWRKTRRFGDVRRVSCETLLREPLVRRRFSGPVGASSLRWRAIG